MTGLLERLQPPASVPYPGAHLGLRWRPFIPSDAPAVHDLVRRVEAADDAIRRSGPGAVADMMEGRGGLDPVEAIVGLDAEHRTCAVASVRILSDVTEVGVALVKAAIDPHWRGRGVGRALLYWQDGRARQMLVETFGADSEIPVQVMNVVDSHMTDRRRLSIAAGFSAKCRFMTMHRELEGSERPLTPRGDVTVTHLAPSDLAEARALHSRVFLEHALPHLRDLWWQEYEHEYDPRWSFTARDADGTIIGYLLGVRPVDQWVATGITEAGIGVLGVSPERRGEGLAQVLLTHAIAAANEAGMTRISLDVDVAGAHGAHALYERHGFVDDRAEVHYTIDH